MRTHSLAHLCDEALEREAIALEAHDRTTIAELLRHLAEMDARKMFVPRGCPSLHDYCVRVLGRSPDRALKRIQAARAL